MLLWRYIILLIVSKLSGSSGNACDLILEMDIDNKGNVYVPVNTAVNASFMITGEKCNLDTNLYITANKGDAYSCNIRVIEGQCSEGKGTTTCRCTSQKKIYKFTRTLTRKDIGEWFWRVRNDYDNVISKTMEFNLLFLKVNGKEVTGRSIVNQYETVLIECYWERGNQPIKIHLLDSTGKMLVGNTDVISHNYTFHTCQDTGNIRCETERWNISLSANFLVNCAPEFCNSSLEIINIPYGRNVESTFIVSTPRIHTCEISHISKSTNDRNVTEIFIQNHQCRVEITDFGYQKEKPQENITTFKGLNKCLCRIHGPISNSTLFLSINNINTNESGVWRLTVSNDLGNCSAFTYLNVYTVYWENVFTKQVIISLISCVAIVVSSTIITLVVYKCKGRYKSYDRPRRKKHQALVVYTSIGPQQREDVTIYEEIRDVENTGSVRAVNSHDLTTMADGDYDYPLADKYA